MTIRRDPNQQLIEFTDFITADGQTLHLDTLTRFLVSDTGYGMAPVKYIDQQGPFQHGRTIHDFRLDQRVIQMVIRENGCSRQQYWNIRANLLNFLRPNRQIASGGFSLGTLVKTFPDGSKRAIDVTVEEGPEFKAREVGKWDEWAIYETLRFIAPDPTFYDPTQNTVDFGGVKVVRDQVTFPVEFDDTHIIFDVGDDTSLSPVDITYDGTWLSYPIITLTGPMTGPVITNTTTGDKVDLTAYTIIATDVVTIDLSFGRKTITSIINGNLLGYLSTDSDLATFHIACHPDAPNGVNNIEIVAEDQVLGITAASIAYWTRYIGI